MARQWVSVKRAVWLCCLSGLLLHGPACGVNAESDSGLVLVVTVDERVVVHQEAPPLDSIRFYVALQVNEGNDVWVLNEALAGRPVDVSGQDLWSDPYRLFVAAGNGVETQKLRVLVVGEKDGERRLWGVLRDPGEQVLQRGRILERMVALGPKQEGVILTWTETGCLMSSDGAIRFGSAQDRDCDGYISTEYGGEDCDDENPAVNPAAEDYNDCDGIDNNCDGIIDPGGDLDVDGDGWSACEGDCDDDNPDVYPGAPELCDGIDNNCNGKCDEGHDQDGDGFTPCGTRILPGGALCLQVPVGDCDDNDPNVHPEAPELCDGIDNNCNGKCDEGTDEDGDGFNACGSIPGELLIDGIHCTPPSPDRIDCAPEDPSIYPGAPELCDGLNNDCNANTSAPPTLCYTENAGQSPGTTRCYEGVAHCIEEGGAGGWGECVAQAASPEVSPALCAAWTLCSSSPDPAACMASYVIELSLDCLVHMTSVEGGPCHEDPPTYYLPLGVSHLGSCQWFLQIHSNTMGWYEVGLVDPANPQAPAGTLQSCNAALVARPSTPHYEELAAINGTISFVHVAGEQSVLAVIPFVVHKNYDCAHDSSLSCILLDP